MPKSVKPCNYPDGDLSHIPEHIMLRDIAIYRANAQALSDSSQMHRRRKRLHLARADARLANVFRSWALWLAHRLP